MFFFFAPKDSKKAKDAKGQGSLSGDRSDDDNESSWEGIEDGLENENEITLPIEETTVEDHVNAKLPRGKDDNQLPLEPNNEPSERPLHSSDGHSPQNKDGLDNDIEHDNDVEAASVEDQLNENESSRIEDDNPPSLVPTSKDSRELPPCEGGCSQNELANNKREYETELIGKNDDPSPLASERPLYEHPGNPPQNDGTSTNESEIATAIDAQEFLPTSSRDENDEDEVACTVHSHTISAKIQEKTEWLSGHFAKSSHPEPQQHLQQKASPRRKSQLVQERLEWLQERIDIVKEQNEILSRHAATKDSCSAAGDTPTSFSNRRRKSKLMADRQRLLLYREDVPSTSAEATSGASPFREQQSRDASTSRGVDSDPTKCLQGLVQEHAEVLVKWQQLDEQQRQQEHNQEQPQRGENEFESSEEQKSTHFKATDMGDGSIIENVSSLSLLECVAQPGTRHFLEQQQDRSSPPTESGAIKHSNNEISADELQMQYVEELRAELGILTKAAIEMEQEGVLPGFLANRTTWLLRAFSFCARGAETTSIAGNFTSDQPKTTNCDLQAVLRIDIVPEGGKNTSGSIIEDIARGALSLESELEDRLRLDYHVATDDTDDSTAISTAKESWLPDPEEKVSFTTPPPADSSFHMFSMDPIQPLSTSGIGSDRIREQKDPRQPVVHRAQTDPTKSAVSPTGVSMRQSQYLDFYNRQSDAMQSSIFYEGAGDLFPPW